MTKYVFASTTPVRAQGSFARVLAGPFGKHIALAPENEGGSDDGNKDSSADDAAAKAAADAAAAAAKELADKAADKKDGEKLSDAEHKLLADVMKHKKTAKELKEQLDSVAPLAKAIEDLGGLDKLRALAEAQVAAEKDKLEKAGEFDRLKTMIVEENQKKIKEIQDEVAAKETALSNAQRTIDDLTIGVAFGASEVINDLVLTVAKTRQIYGGHFETENGVVVGYDKPKGSAQRTKLVDGSGEPLSFDAALKKLVDTDPDRDRLMKSKIISGNGSKTTDDKTTVKAGELVGTSRIAAALAARNKK